MSLSLSHWRVQTLLIVALGCYSMLASAQRVQPMNAVMEPVGSKAQLKMRIDNPSDTVLTMEIIPTRIEMDAQGKETWIPADDDLLVIPATTIIQPQQSQSVMVRYIGTPDIESSRSYRVSFKQVPVDLTGAGNGAVALAVNFNTLINVAPKKSQAKLKVRALRAEQDHWIVEVENSGQRYARMSTTQWQLSNSTGAKQVFGGKQVRELIKGNLILPGSVRTFSMQPVKGFDPKLTQIDIKMLRN